MSDFSTWYKQVPQFSRYWLTATVGFSVLAKIGILPAGLLYLDSNLVFGKFQVSDSDDHQVVDAKQTLISPDMAACDIALLLPDWFPLPHELLFPVQLLD